MGRDGHDGVPESQESQQAVDRPELNSNGAPVARATTSAASVTTESGTSGIPGVRSKSKKTRNRTRVSCMNCVKSKRRCDKNQPCSFCVSRSLSCVYQATSQRSSKTGNRYLRAHDNHEKSLRPPSGAGGTRIVEEAVWKNDNPQIFGANITTSTPSRASSTTIVTTTTTTTSSQTPPSVLIPNGAGHIQFNGHNDDSRNTNSTMMSHGAVVGHEASTLSAPAVGYNGRSPHVKSGISSSESATGSINSEYSSGTTNEASIRTFAPPVEQPATTFNRQGTLSQCRVSAEFVVKSAENKQLRVSQYYGSWSGPALLLCKEKHVVPCTESTGPFPKHRVPDHVELFDFYYRHVHWYISCLEWGEFVGWLDDYSANEAIVNALIWMILSISCLAKGDQERAMKYEEEARVLFVTKCNLEPSLNQIYLLFQILQLNVLMMRGQFEELWSKIGETIHVAVSMGFHRKWQFASPDKERNKARLWYTLLHMERFLAIFLGRPYSIGDRFYDCENPLDSNTYDYESTFRDSVNGLVPLMGRLLDELVLPDVDYRHGTQSYNRLLELDQDLSKWIYSLNKDMCNTCRDIRQLHEDRRPPTLVVQHLFIEGLKSFLKGRIHRLFLLNDDERQRSYCTEQYLNANHFLMMTVCALLDKNISPITPEMTLIVIDAALFSCVKDKDSSIRVGCQSCVESTAQGLRKYLTGVMDTTAMGGKKLASSCLHIMDKFEWHRANGDNKLGEMFADSVDPTNWLVWLNNIEWLGD